MDAREETRAPLVRRSRMPPSPRPATILSVLCLVLGTLACHATGKAQEKPGKPEPFVPLPDEEPQSIGYFLTRYDFSLQKWSELQLTGSSARDRNTLAALEKSLEERAKERQAELVDVLQSGSPLYRRVAAAALGFTHDSHVLSALLGVLSDPDPELVQKALLGIGVLGFADTPLGEIRFHLQKDTDAWTRNNAAFALLAITRAGNRSPEIAEACREGTLDTEPGVRAQCTSALGLLADEQAVTPLLGLLHDDANLVALAAASALVSIARVHLEQKGAAARGLADALDQVRADRRANFLKALIWLADRNLGEDASPWREWAYKLP